MACKYFTTVVGYAVILVSRDWIRRHVTVFGQMGTLSQIFVEKCDDALIWSIVVITKRLSV